MRSASKRPIATIAIPYMLGGYIAKGMRMNDYGWKIGIVLSAFCLSVLIIGVLRIPPKLGVDLKGGVILVYEIDEEATMANRELGDTGAIAEAQLRARLLPEGEVPMTPAPTVKIMDNMVHVSSPIGASIGYRRPGDAHWQLYSGPLPDQPLDLKSVRYGWVASPVVRHAH